MIKLPIKAFINAGLLEAQKHTKELLVGVGIAGMMTAVYSGIEATPKAIKLIEKKKEEEHVDCLDTPLVIKTVWKCYIPTVVTFGLSTLCIVKSNTMYAKTNAALLTACSISDSSLKDYKAKVVETIGEKKEEKIHDAILEDKIVSTPMKEDMIIKTGDGNTLCFDATSGRYFWSDINAIDAAVNSFNEMRMNGCSTGCLNDFYYLLKLEPMQSIGEDIGWDPEDKMVKIRKFSILYKGTTPCFAFDFYTNPHYIGRY